MDESAEPNPIQRLFDVVQQIGDNYNRLVRLSNMSQGKMMAIQVALLLSVDSSGGLEGLKDLRDKLQACVRTGEDPREVDLFLFDKPVFGVVGDVLFPDDSKEARDVIRSGLVLEAKAMIKMLDEMISHRSTSPSH